MESPKLRLHVSTKAVLESIKTTFFLKRQKLTYIFQNQCSSPTWSDWKYKFQKIYDRYVLKPNNCTSFTYNALGAGQTEHCLK